MAFMYIHKRRHCPFTRFNCFPNGRPQNKGWTCRRRDLLFNRTIILSSLGFVNSSIRFYPGFPKSAQFCFIRSARVIPSKEALERAENSFHMGSVRQVSARGQGAAPHSKQATGASPPSVRRRISPMRYCSGGRVSL